MPTLKHLAMLPNTAWRPLACVAALLPAAAFPQTCNTADRAVAYLASAAARPQFVERRRDALADLEVQLATLPTEPAQHAESLP